MKTATLTTSITRQGFCQLLICRPGQAKREPGPITRNPSIEQDGRWSSPNSGLWLWVPAFAGTTAGYSGDSWKLQNKPAQIGVLGEVADMLLHVIGIDLHRL